VVGAMGLFGYLISTPVREVFAARRGSRKHAEPTP
jgi:hypothetical protein